jgi:hypothetical protein
MASAPASPRTANGRAASASHPGGDGRVSSTSALITTSATTSAARSDNAVASTYAPSSPPRELMMTVRTSSPPRAGRKLLPKYPAAVAQNTVDTGTEPSALSRMRHRHALSSKAVVAIAAARTRRPGAAAPTIRQTSRQSIPRSE